MVSIKGVEESKLSVSDLQLVCDALSTSDYKCKKSGHVLLLIVLQAHAMSVQNIMHPLLPALEVGYHGGSGIDLSNKSSHAANNMFVNADTADEESVVAEEEKYPQFEQEEEQIIFLSATRNQYWAVQRISPPASTTKIGTYFRVNNVIFRWDTLQ